MRLFSSSASRLQFNTSIVGEITLFLNLLTIHSGTDSVEETFPLLIILLFSQKSR